jgi:hypothetical protein
VGIIRKTLSAGAFMAGVPVIQFRSDTERVAYQVKKLRKSVDAQGRVQEHLVSGDDSGYQEPTRPVIDLSAAAVSDVSVSGTSIFSSRTVTEADTTSDALTDNSSPGWKTDPDDCNHERFWNGTSWTSIRRDAPRL